MAGSSVGTKISTHQSISNTLFLSYFTTLGVTQSNTIEVQYGVIFEEVFFDAVINKTVVDCFWKNASEPSWIDMAVNTDAVPCIAYYGGDNFLHWAERSPSNSQWSIEPVGLVSNEAMIGIAFSTENHPFIVFQETDSLQLGAYTKTNGGSWFRSNITTNLPVKLSAQLSLAETGGFRVCCRSSTNDNQLVIFGFTTEPSEIQTISVPYEALNDFRICDHYSPVDGSFIFYSTTSNIFHAIKQQGLTTNWQYKGSFDASNVGSGLRHAKIIDGRELLAFSGTDLMLLYFNEGSSTWEYNVVAEQECFPSCTYTWTLVGYDAAIAADGCDNISIYYRVITGNKAVGNNNSYIVRASAGSLPIIPSVPHEIDWKWAYHDDDDGVDDRRSEMVPGANTTFIPSRPIMEGEGFRIYFLTGPDFAGDNTGNAWVRWWSGTAEQWFPANPLYSIDLYPNNFHDLPDNCPERLTVWKSDIWGTATGVGTNYYSIQLTSTSISPWDQDYLLRTVSDSGSSGHNQLNQAMSENPDFYQQDWPINIHADQDSDGIGDDWEIQYFGNITNCVATTDSDGDGIDNRGEFLLGSNPNDENSSLVAVIEKEPNRLMWNSKKDHWYQVQWKDFSDTMWMNYLNNPVVESNGSLSEIQSIPILFETNAQMFRVILLNW